MPAGRPLIRSLSLKTQRDEFKVKFTPNWGKTPNK